MSRNKKIKCGFCVAYDWELLQYSLPPIYSYCDIIVLSIDKDCVSWNGSGFSFDETAFLNLVISLDPDKKIKIYRDCFYLNNLTPVQNEARQRNLLADFMGRSDWHLQIDTDEYLLNPEELFESIDIFDSRSNPLTIRCQWITLFKQIPEGYFIVKNGVSKREFVSIATNDPKYIYGRNTYSANYFTNCLILHQSWARSKEEIFKKISSWGHTHDADFSKFKELWLKLNKENYHEVKNIHPLNPKNWNSLEYIPADSIRVLLSRGNWEVFKLSKFRLIIMNSRILSKIRQLLNG